MSLAQLPIMIRQKYNKEIDVKYLGFAKLKDFIIKNKSFEIWNRGPNYPHVRLKKEEIPLVSRPSSSSESTDLLNRVQRLNDIVLTVVKINFRNKLPLAEVVDNVR